jgi:hypothetical protein
LIAVHQLSIVIQKQLKALTYISCNVNEMQSLLSIAGMSGLRADSGHENQGFCAAE